MKTNAAFFISLLLVFVFANTASSKLIDSTGFIGVLRQVPLIGRGAGVMAVLLPLAELLIAMLLIFETTRLFGLYASLVLLLIFTGYLLYMILTLSHLPCSCGGVISKMSWRMHLIFNAALSGLTVIGIRTLNASAVKNHG